MDNNILIRESFAWRITATPPDVILLPNDASLFTMADWQALATAAGGEDNLLNQLGVTYAPNQNT